MILDASAVVGIVLREPGYEDLRDKLSTPASIGIGTPTLAEAGIVIANRLRIDSVAILAELCTEFEIIEIPFGEPHWRETARAFRRFGRNQHPASLNFGDCMAYAVAKLAGEPLLFLGDDFSKTDIDAA